MKEDPFAFWAAQLEELTPAEEAEVTRMVGLAQRGADITLNTWASALMMRYNFDRWNLIMRQVRKRLEGKA